MRAITVRQPWAWGIVHGSKNIENRTRISSWKRAEGERVAIHAGQGWAPRGDQVVRHPGVAMLDFGAIIGTADVTEVHWADQDCDPDVCGMWGEQSYVENGGTHRTSVVHLVLENRRPCPPVPCRGALGLWRLPDDVQRELTAVTTR